MKKLFSLFIGFLCVGIPFGSSAEEINTSTRAAHVAVRNVKKSAVGTQDKSGKSDKNAKEKDLLQTDEKKGELIAETLDYGIQEERIKAISKIPQINNSSIKTGLVNKLLELMKDETDPEFLTKAIAVLGELKEKNAIPILTEKLDHPSEDVRIAAAYALKSTNGVSAKEKMIQKLKEQNLENYSNFTEALLNALAEFNAQEVIPLVKEALASGKTNSGVKENLIIFAGKIQAKDAKDVLLKLYKDDDEDVLLRAFAVNSLAKMGFADIAPQIKEVIKTIESLDLKKRKKYHTLHLYSVAALAKLGDADAVPKLIQSLRSNSSDVRLKAVILIKEFKDKRTIDILKYKMKYDQNSKVRSEAKKALEEWGVDIKDEKK